jgi:uncharacterized membrane-anchored protein YitT (DUF2179 family)
MMLNNKKMKNKIINYTFIVLGSFLMALGIVAFLSPNHIATGGTAGLAIVLNYLLPIPIGFLMGLINLPLLILSLKYLGRQFAIDSIVCIFLVMIFIEILTQIFHLPAFSHHLFLSTMYGGIAIGAGLGFIFKGGASAGGGSIIAKIIASKTSFKASNVILIIDAVVVISAGMVFKSMELALWSLISIYVASRLIDVIIVGSPSQKIVHISSSKNLTELSKLITAQMNISGTIVKGNDLSDNEYKDIIFLMIDKTRLNVLKQLVLAYDENVKMIVMEATEVLG